MTDKVEAAEAPHDEGEAVKRARAHAVGIARDIADAFAIERSDGASTSALFGQLADELLTEPELVRAIAAWHQAAEQMVDAPAFGDRVDAMLAAAHEAETERDQYRAGNTTLLDLLMRAAKGEQTADEAILWRDRLQLEMLQVLETAGLAQKAPDGSYRLLWGALEARKPKPQTWVEAVNECVTDPEARARLLAME